MTPKAALGIYSALILTIFALAYLGMIPTKLHVFPYYDSAGHFFLYGLWGYFFGNALPKPLASIGKRRFQKGIAVAASIAIIEEFMQKLSPVRSFSYADLAFGLAGIFTACAILNLKKKKEFSPP